jgi:hypothetical protein
MTRRTTPATHVTGDHGLRLALLVLGIVTLAKAAFLFTSGFSLSFVGFRDSWKLRLRDRQISRGWLRRERITLRPLVVLQRFLRVMPLPGRLEFILDSDGM